MSKENKQKIEIVNKKSNEEVSVLFHNIMKASVKVKHKIKKQKKDSE